MKFTRVNKDTVNCIITEDDMDEQGLRLEDLFDKSQEAMDFLHEVMEKAAAEVDYKPQGAFTPMQITVLPDHSISLTLSENTEGAFADMLKNLTEKAGLRFPKNFLEELGDVPEEDRIPKLSEYLQSLKDFTNSVKNMVEKTSSDMNDKEDDSIPVKRGSVRQTRIENRDEKRVSEELEKIGFKTFVFSIKDLRTAILLSKQIPDDVVMGSTLYRNPSDNMFYMVFDRKDENAKTFAAVFSVCYEFGKFVTTKNSIICHMDENFDTVLNGDAIERLRSL
ncbi:adaptor protein MecA [Butyrivibrio sp. INlla16]|uniref:adaptor protein MecA n=1 Tax=Butyrivibrio sp. INlla16 TaxID=1520807 RepID=UPI00088E632B|nr:adaptor protein MecA [Butyrivibrio sp. INlla16]SDB38923.1 adapter protein MecA 1/2 [Butyrivibrio sp. INlla16]